MQKTLSRQAGQDAPASTACGGQAGFERRETAIDALRGAVMVIMALDHTRDFFHAGAMTFSPEDLAKTTPILFFTRWITHVCAPVFVFLAGMGASFRLKADASRARVSRFLLTRGLWLVLVELTVMRLAMNFTFDARYPVLLLILWALGVSMMAMAALIYLPRPAIAALSLAILLLHNAADGVRAAELGAFAGVWQVLHQPGVLRLSGTPVLVGYPVLPWIGVMAAGFCFAPIFRWDARRRQRALVLTGTSLVGLFVLVRAINLYGDPAPWSPQTSAAFTVLSFLRTTKYPPSLAFLLMTLGPALLALAYLDRRRVPSAHPLVVIGRVPFFYYVTHFWALHLLASVMAWLRYGERSFEFLFMPLPSMGAPGNLFPPDFGYSLWLVHVVWVGVVILLYPLCRWFARFKSRRRAWWTSYL